MKLTGKYSELDMTKFAWLFSAVLLVYGMVTGDQSFVELATAIGGIPTALYIGGRSYVKGQAEKGTTQREAIETAVKDALAAELVIELEEDEEEVKEDA